MRLSHLVQTSACTSRGHGAIRLGVGVATGLLRFWLHERHPVDKTAYSCLLDLLWEGRVYLVFLVQS
jgi:hypothetical protein